MNIQRKAALETLELKSLLPSTTQEPRSASLNNSGGGENNYIRAYVNQSSRSSQWSVNVLGMRSPDGKGCT